MKFNHILPGTEIDYHVSRLIAPSLEVRIAQNVRLYS